jgi:predicted  nucleic acid-binding Zn-ribbon protein
MNPDLQKLIELDKVSQEISSLKDEIAALPKKVAEIETKLNAAKGQVEAAKNDIKGLETNKRKSESEIQDWQQKISKFREQSLSVKTNEQYKALMTEIEFAEKHISECEEKILAGMDSTEGFNGALKKAEEELRFESAAIAKETEHVKAVTAEDEKKLAVLNTQRQSLREAVDPATLSHFERIASKRKGAIAEAFDQKCGACNVMLRPQKYNELLADKGGLVTCDSCGRILYVDAERQAANKTPSKSNEKAWFFRAGAEENTGQFLYFANSKGSCTMKSFDAGTGRMMEKVIKKKTVFRDAFPELLKNVIPLHPEHLNMHQDFDEQLPADVLEEFQLQSHISPDSTATVPTAQ